MDNLIYLNATSAKDSTVQTETSFSAILIISLSLCGTIGLIFIILAILYSLFSYKKVIALIFILFLLNLN